MYRKLGIAFLFACFATSFGNATGVPKNNVPSSGSPSKTTTQTRYRPVSKLGVHKTNLGQIVRNNEAKSDADKSGARNATDRSRQMKANMQKMIDKQKETISCPSCIIR